MVFNRNIAVIAHDKKKPDLRAFLKDIEDWLWQRNIIATGRTAEFIESEDLKVKVQHLSRGRSGGYVQITEMLKNGEISVVFFFRDHEVKNNHEDIENLLKTCNVMNIPLATNRASAELLILGVFHKEKANKKTNPDVRN
ncbi:methylglyoxal synthase [Hyphobacterium sp. CCMP332]|nr:methylglyoxal synthase [Hyphobacterium sp. CCMP332]